MTETFLLTRRYSLRATHKLSSPELTDEENKKTFGKCLNKHGHNYKIHVTVSAPQDPVSGLIIDRQTLDEAVHQFLIWPYDKTHLNDSFEITTGEYLAVQFKALLKESPIGPYLVEIMVRETPKNFFIS